MSEEKPTFKVTDRRLFNADGTPRDVEREEEPVIISTPDVASSTASPAGAAATTSRESARGASSTATQTGDASASTARTREEREEPRDAGDPNAFVNLLMFIASPAAAALGMTEHPGTGPQDLDLPLAKHCIDLLGTLQQKTRGNLTAQEQQLFEGLLAELRMQYVSLTTTRSSSGPRGFTGKDITGGR